MPKFSVITPVHLWNDNRVELFLKTIESLKKQTFRDFEWVIVDDGSVVEFLWDRAKEIGVNVTIIHKEHEERVIAYNQAFKEAQGEWFTLLDSDDEYKPDSLFKFNQMIEKYPQEKMFNCGAGYHQKDGTTTYRDPFTPKRRAVGHEKFGGGNIVNGTFIFHRSVYEDLGGYPGDEKGRITDVDCSALNYGGVRDLYMGSPYDFSAAAQLEFPEIRDYFMVKHPDHPKGLVKELGNPWGQDYFLFYKYTRKYHSRVFKEYLYLVNPR